MEIDETIIADLKSKHGPKCAFEMVDADGVQVIVRNANPAEWLRFKDMANDDRRRHQAADYLARSCVVYPERNVLDDIYSRQPGLVDSFAGAIAELSGVAKEVQKKRL